MFRTYNASVTLDRLLWSNEDGLPGDGIAREGTVDLKKASYDRANKEVCPVDTWTEKLAEWVELRNII